MECAIVILSNFMSRSSLNHVLMSHKVARRSGSSVWPRSSTSSSCQALRLRRGHGGQLGTGPRR